MIIVLSTIAGGVFVFKKFKLRNRKLSSDDLSSITFDNPFVRAPPGAESATSIELEDDKIVKTISSNQPVRMSYLMKQTKWGDLLADNEQFEQFDSYN